MKKKDYFTGGQPSSDEESEDEIKYTDPKYAFAARAKRVDFKTNAEAFYKQKDLITKFGKASIVLMRAGFDREAGVFKIYLKVL